MADYSFLSDTDDSAVEELIAQATDLSVLEQVAAINCSGITDYVLPTDLDNRFRKLKTFPPPNTKRKSSPPRPHLSQSDVFDSKNKLNCSFEAETASDSPSDGENVVFSAPKRKPREKIGFKPKSRSASVSLSFNPSNSSMEGADSSHLKKIPDEKNGMKSKSQSRSVSSPMYSSYSPMENAFFSSLNESPDGKRATQPKSRSGSFSSPSSSLDSSGNSPSPPQKTGCFWCSPKRVSRKKSKENRVPAISLDWDKGEQILSDLGTFSVKEQKKTLKKAMKKQEEISREAEKIVKWAKQASARMNVSGIEDKLSDEDASK